MTEPTALDEIVAKRNRLVDDRQKAEEAISSTLRTVGMGLAAVAYSFVFVASPNPALAAHKVPIFAASALGALSILLDILRSFAQRTAAQSALGFLAQRGDEDCRPTPSEIIANSRTSGGSVAFGLLVLRALACFLGFVCLLVGIAKSL
jgi:transposase